MKSPDVLIIEPSEDLAEVMAEALKRKGFTSALAHTAQEGIVLADKHMPKLVIIELIIPRHNGMEFIHEFRSYPEWLDVPIILYSHLSPDELGASPEVLSDMGVFEHLYKPTTSLQKLVESAESVFAPVDI